VLYVDGGYSAGKLSVEGPLHPPDYSHMLNEE
jgi:hypothetical protein